MKRLAFAMLFALVLFALPASAAKPAAAGKVVHVYIVAPSNAVTPITSAQAASAADLWMGQVNGWFQQELGQVVSYDITVVPMGPVNSPTDACGSWSAPFLYFQAVNPIEAVGGGFTTSDRTMILMLGAGGWAGHFSPADRKVEHFGMVGDWGVMEQYDARTSCVPEWDYPNRGFSHEFAGMMGAYVTSGYNEGGLFVGDALSENQKRDLLKYSGRWLRSP